MNEDFALVDFALVAAPPERVVQALGQVHALQAAASGSAQGARGAEIARPGRLARTVSRLLGRAAAAPLPLLIQPEGHLPPPPLARLMVEGLGFGAGRTPFRVSAPVGAMGLTLVEFRDGDTEHSPVAAALSAELPGAEVFRFRLSGPRHPGAETAFHVYLDGRAVRRTASISPEGTAPEAEWRVVDTGIPHAVEADSLPHARARAWDVMTPARQGAILTALGVVPDALFEMVPGRVALDLSPEPGGAPLAAAGRLLAARAAQSRTPAKAHPHPRPGEGAAKHPAEPEALLPGDPPAPQIPDDSDALWETEVTQILVTAVAHALPPDAQVPWLSELTAKLEDGRVTEALAEAHSLIARGDRPAADRAADAARLNALFGVDDG